MRKTAALMILLGLATCFLAFQIGGIGLGLAWLGGNFVALGIGYTFNRPGLVGKHRNGALAWWSWVVFLPYHLLNHAVWHVLRIVSRENASDNVTSNLVVGRRLLATEVPGEFANYVDLTAEFTEPRQIRMTQGYVSFPILDGGVPNSASLKSSIAALRNGRTYVHCAQGHGRTGLFSIALLLVSGSANTVGASLKLLQAARPGLRLNSAQLSFVENFQRELRKETT